VVDAEPAQLFRRDSLCLGEQYGLADAPASGQQDGPRRAMVVSGLLERLAHRRVDLVAAREFVRNLVEPGNEWVLVPLVRVPHHPRAPSAGA
jgi:hypothetical protein